MQVIFLHLHIQKLLLVEFLFVFLVWRKILCLWRFLRCILIAVLLLFRNLLWESFLKILLSLHNFATVLNPLLLENLKELILIIFARLIHRPKFPQFAWTTRFGRRLQKARYILRPCDILKFLIIIKIEVIQLFVMKFLFKYLLNQFIDILNLTINESLKHSESLSIVKNLKSRQSS